MRDRNNKTNYGYFVCFCIFSVVFLVLCGVSIAEDNEVCFVRVMTLMSIWSIGYLLKHMTVN